MTNSWQNPLISSFPVVEYQKAFKSGNTVVVGLNNDAADYGPFTVGTSTDGWQEAVDALNLSSSPGMIVALGGSYSWSAGLSVIVPSNGQFAIFGIGTGNSQTTNPSNRVSVTSNIPSGNTVPFVLIACSATSVSYPSAFIENVYFYGNGNEVHGLVSVTVGTNLTNVSVSGVGGQAGIAQIGYPSSVRYRGVTGQIGTPSTPSSNALSFGTSTVAAGIYFNGADNITSLFGYDVFGRPEARGSQCFGQAGTQTNTAGAYFADCNWIEFEIGVNGVATGIDMYHPFADNYNWGWIFITHIENVTGDAFRLDGSAVGEGGAAMPTGVILMLGNSSNGSTPSISATGCALHIIGLGQGAVGAAPTSVSVGASPYTYTNTYPDKKMVTVSGVTNSTIQFNGSTTGLTEGTFWLNYGDNVTVVYGTITPTMLVSTT